MTTFVVAKELLVYSGSIADDNLLGAIFAGVEDTIEQTIQLIKRVRVENGPSVQRDWIEDWMSVEIGADLLFQCALIGDR